MPHRLDGLGELLFTPDEIPHPPTPGKVGKFSLGKCIDQSNPRWDKAVICWARTSTVLR